MADGKFGQYGSLAENPKLFEQALAAETRINNFRRIHVGLFLLNFFLNGMTLLAFSYWVIETAPHCTLHSHWSVLAAHRNGSLLLDENGSRFGDGKHCQIVQYIFATGCVASFVLVWFFILFQPTIKRFLKRESTHASLIVCPATVVSVAFVFAIGVACAELTVGFASWCTSFSEDGRTGRCADSMLVNVPQGHQLHFSHVQMSLVLGWISLLCWIGNLYVLLHRLVMHLDFPVAIYGPYNSPFSGILDSKESKL